MRILAVTGRLSLSELGRAIAAQDVYVMTFT